MAIFGLFNQQGFPTAFYDERLHGERKRPIYKWSDEIEIAPQVEEEVRLDVLIVGYEPNPDCTIPSDAIEITEQQHAEFVEFSGLRRWDNGIVVEYKPPTAEPEPPVTILPAVTLWERMTEEEAEQVAEVMETQPFRTRKIFETAATFRSDHELWQLLESIAIQLFGEERASEILSGE